MGGETYHIFNRGAHKGEIFTCRDDYERFLVLLYLANSSTSLHLSNILKKYGGLSLISIFEGEEVDQSLVEIYAYCLMPNHFHLVIKPLAEHSLPLFMKKLATAYSMYFNTKYEHSGVVFQGPYKSKHVGEEAYFRYIFSYVHLNALDLVDPGWKVHGCKDIRKARDFFNSYRYSSFPDYSIGERLERKILSFEHAPPFLKEMNDLEELFKYLEQGQSLIQ